MGLLKLVPKPLQRRLLLKLLVGAVEHFDPVEVGTQANVLMDAQFGTEASDAAQDRLAAWLRTLAERLEA